MSIFSKISESKIFKDEKILSPEYLPEFLPHREEQIKQLARNLLPASKRGIPQNTFLYGPPGIGKTAVVKFVFREFEEFTERVKTIYINCWNYNTSHAILTRIASDLKAFVHRRGMSKDQILERLIEVCKKTDKGLVICLDEVDQLIFKENKALYDLLRINQYIDNPVGLVLISNDPYVFNKLEPRVKSSLNVEEIEFKPYSLNEMKDILKERTDLAFHAGIMEIGVLAICANYAVQNGGDVRIGLECLIKAGRAAEDENSNKIKVEHVKKVLKTVKPVKPRIVKERVSETEKIILKIVDKNKKLFSGELYKIYCKEVDKPISERAFRDYVNHLIKVKLLKTKTVKKGLGRTRLISKT